MLTAQQLIQIVPYVDRANAPNIVAALNKVLPEYEFNTRARIAGLLGQVVPETGSFRFTREVWTNSVAQRKYEFNPRLGNTKRGQGFFYRGVGMIQATGFLNLNRLGKKLGLDLVRHPELGESLENSARIACEYLTSKRTVWTSRGIERNVTGLELCDRGDWLGLSRFVNGSVKTPNGLQTRLEYTNRALSVLRNIKPESVKPVPKMAHRTLWNNADVTGKRGQLLITPELVGRVLTVNAKEAGKTQIGFKKEGQA
jgi:putative chitinase